jgi:hypothetical protein
MYPPPAVVSLNKFGVFVEVPLKDLTAKAFINLVVGYQEEGIDKYLVVTSYALANCHICRASIDVAVFSQRNGRWHMDLNQKGVTQGGSFGHIDKGSWVAIGPDKHGVLLHGAYGGQGYSGDTTIIIAEVDGTFKEVFSLLTMESYHDPVGKNQNAWGYASQLDFENGSSPYYDIVIKQVGTDRDGKPLPEQSVYRFSHGGYELVTQPR